MSVKSEVDQEFLALVESGNIRYETLPAAVGVNPCAVGAWREIIVAALSPAVPFWLCGFKVSFATGLVTERAWRISLGYGGADAGAGAATTVLITRWYLSVIGAAAAAMGGCETQLLPYPIKIPVDQVSPGSRFAYSVVDNPVGAALGLTDCRIILAYAIGG